MNESRDSVEYAFAKHGYGWKAERRLEIADLSFLLNIWSVLNAVTFYEAELQIS